MLEDRTGRERWRDNGEGRDWTKSEKRRPCIRGLNGRKVKRNERRNDLAEADISNYGVRGEGEQRADLFRGGNFRPAPHIR